MKVCLDVALKHDIPLKVVATKNSPLSEYKTFRGHMAGNVEYLATLDKALAKYKDYDEASCWWITKHFRTVFASTWNLKYQSSTSTRFSRRAYMAQVVPSLMMTMAL